jgi:hypothetical protein
MGSMATIATIENEEIRFPYFRMIWIDKEGLSLYSYHIAYILYGMMGLFLPEYFLSYWFIVIGVIGFFMLFSTFLFTDQFLIYQESKQYKGLSLVSFAKMASLRPYIRNQNPVYSWLIANIPYGVHQWVLLLWSIVILCLADKDGAKLLTASPFYLIFRYTPCHDIIAMNLFMTGILSYRYIGILSAALFLLGVWIKFYAWGFKRFERNQTKIFDSFHHNERKRKKGIFYEFHRKTIASLLLFSGGALLHPIYLIGFILFYWYGMRTKYFLYLLPLVLL